MRKSMMFATAIVAFTSISAPALAADCSKNVANASNVPKAIINCLETLRNENNALREIINVLESREPTIKVSAEMVKEAILADSRAVELLTGTPGDSAKIPFGAVIAFDGWEYEKAPEGRLQSGCPFGWVRFEQAAGRLIIGSDSYPGFEPSQPKLSSGNGGGRADIQDDGGHIHGRGNVRSDIPDVDVAAFTGDGTHYHKGSIMPPILLFISARKTELECVIWLLNSEEFAPPTKNL